MCTKREEKINRLYMEMAISTSKLSYCIRKKVGVVIVKDERVIVNGYNGTLSGEDNRCEDTVVYLPCGDILIISEEEYEKLYPDKLYTHRCKCGLTHSYSSNDVSLKTNVNVIHAEANAILFAKENGIDIRGSTLYTTLSPCVNCALKIVAAGIKKVVWSDSYKCTDGLEILKTNNIEILKFT